MKSLNIVQICPVHKQFWISKQLIMPLPKSLIRYNKQSKLYGCDVVIYGINYSSRQVILFSRHHIINQSREFEVWLWWSPIFKEKNNNTLFPFNTLRHFQSPGYSACRLPCNFFSFEKLSILKWNLYKNVLTSDRDYNRYKRQFREQNKFFLVPKKQASQLARHLLTTPLPRPPQDDNRHL